MAMSLTIGFCVIYHPFEEGASLAKEMHDKGLEFLVSLRLDVVDAPVLVHDLASARAAGECFSQARVDAIVLHLATWSDDTLLLEIVACHDVPVVTWAVRDLHSGSLCGCQQFGMVIRELDRDACFVLGYQETMASKIQAFIGNHGEKTSVRARRRASLEREFPFMARARHLRIGIIGARTQGMMEVAFDEFGLKSTFGFSVMSISLDEIKERAMKVPDDMASREMDSFLERNRRARQNIPRDELLRAGRMYVALKRTCSDLALEALAVECYPRFMGAVCIPFSMLSDDGIACACEGDVHAAFLMWLVHTITGEPSNHVDLLDVDPATNTFVGSHCGSSSTRLADGNGEVVLSRVRLAGDGGCILFPSKPGDVTLACLVGRSGTYRACILYGEALPAGLVFPGNPVSVKLDKPVEDFLAIVEEHGFGHHWVVAYGRAVGRELASLLRRLGVRIIE